MIVHRIVGSVLLTLAMASAHAFDFKTIASGPVILYDAPSLKGGKLFIAPRGMPVEVVLTYGEWAKVRDAAGDTSWIEQRLLSSRRNVVVRVNNARVRSQAEEGSNALMTAERGVLLELIDTQGGWVKVRHRDGISGYIRSSDIWGV